jgi:hypothetical protein
MSYEELKNLQEEMKEEEEETEQIIMEEEEEQEEEQEESIEEITAGAGDKVPPKREVLSGEEETLEELLERLKKETDTLRYNDLAVRIKERAEVVIFEEHFDDAFSRRA